MKTNLKTSELSLLAEDISQQLKIVYHMTMSEKDVLRGLRACCVNDAYDFGVMFGSGEGNPYQNFFWWCASTFSQKKGAN